MKVTKRTSIWTTVTLTALMIVTPAVSCSQSASLDVVRAYHFGPKFLVEVRPA